MSKIEDTYTTHYAIGIDPALSTTGYGVLNHDTEEIIYVGKVNSSAKYNTEDRILHIVEHVLSITSQYPINEIYIEDGYSGPNRNTSLKLASLRGGFTTIFKLNKYKVSLMQPSEIRKRIGLSGQSKKDDVYRYLKTKYPNEKKLIRLGEFNDKSTSKSKNSDIFDAVGICLAGIRKTKEEGL